MRELSGRLYQGTELRQEMKINTRLYQAMELLHMPLLDLEQHLKQEMAENPFLEMAEPEISQEVSLDEEREQREDGEIDWEEILLDGFDAGGFRGQREEREYRDRPTVEIQNLRDRLEEQLHHLPLSDRQVRLGEEIVGNIDDAGFLSCPLEEVVEGDFPTVQVQNQEELKDSIESASFW
jgi:RNA polymerase sigma-54 factor